jgi:UDP-glucose 4-epimerase
MANLSVLVTGAGGYVGKQIISALVASKLKPESTPNAPFTIVSADVREIPMSDRLNGVHYVVSDVRKPGLAEILKTHQIQTVVHLASIVTPGKNHNRDFEYSVDVEGTKNVLEACIEAKVQHIVISSSGAAYGYHSDNSPWLNEADPIRGNFEIPYSWHKRLVEEMLTEYRVLHPELKQTIFRIGTVLGATVKNQITDLFEKPRLIGIQGSDTPFVFIWDQDLIQILLQAIHTQKAGIFNVAGDGALTIDELANRLQKSVVRLPATLLQSALWLLRKFKLTQYGPEQIKFLRYRPVLSNQKLKSEFGFIPTKTSSEVFDFWLNTKQKQKASV